MNLLYLIFLALISILIGILCIMYCKEAKEYNIDQRVQSALIGIGCLSTATYIIWGLI